MRASTKRPRTVVAAGGIARGLSRFPCNPQGTPRRRLDVSVMPRRATGQVVVRQPQRKSPTYAMRFNANGRDST